MASLAAAPSGDGRRRDDLESGCRHLVGLVKESDSQWVHVPTLSGGTRTISATWIQDRGTQKGNHRESRSTEGRRVSPEIIKAPWPNRARRGSRSCARCSRRIIRPRPEISQWAHAAAAHAHRSRRRSGASDRPAEQDDQQHPGIARRRDRGRRRRHRTIDSTDAEGAKGRDGQGRGDQPPPSRSETDLRRRVPSVRTSERSVEDHSGKTSLPHHERRTNTSTAVGDVCKVGRLHALSR